jgi:carbonic anhydrase/acetyltransferase-like protein (isoleucine patch superfamily)
MVDTPSTGHQAPVILPVKGVYPQFGLRTWLAPNATVVGRVTTGHDCSIWFGAVVRGDVCAIHIGDEVNVQDGAVLHGTFEKTHLEIHDRASIGHNAIVHGCTVHEGALIGMGAVVMDRAVVGAGAVVAAGAVVLEGTQIGAGELWAGVPARRVKVVDPSLAKVLAETSKRYQEYAGWFSGDGPSGVSP